MQFTKFLPNQGGRTKVVSGFVQRRSTMLFLMRVSVFYVALISGSIQLSLASSSIGQKLDETYVTVELNHESLQALFEKIEKQTNLLFTFPEGVKSYNALTLVGGRRSVKETLDLVLKDTPVTYKQINGNLVAVFVGVEERKAEDVKTAESNKSAMSLALITGTVKDASTQEPLAGVNVIVKGTTKGTATDAEGKFAIDANDDEMLVFSFIGFKTFETQVSGQTVFNVAMEVDALALKEVEVRSTNYWTETKERSTGNIAKVTAKDIENQPVTSPLMALQGRMAGVDVTPYNGVAGSAPKIRVRGNNSLRTNGSFPLYVIDGVPIDSSPIESVSYSLFDNGFDPLSTISPANIESVEVLKDGAATAIYGSRGANGVVLIKTKKSAGTGKTNFSVNLYSGVGKMANRLDLLNTQQFLAMKKEANVNDGLPAISGTELTQWDTTKYTDWQDKMLGGTGNITDLQVAFSGGNSNTSFTLSGGYHKENVIFPGDFGYRLLSGHFSLNHSSVDQKFKLLFSANYGANNNKQFDDLNFLSSVLRLPPNAPSLYDENGDLNWAPVEFFPGFIFNSWINPLSYLRNTHEASSNNLVANSVVSYEFLPGLSFKVNLGVTQLNNSERVKNPISAQSPYFFSPPVGSARFGITNRRSWIVEPQILYTKDFGGGHNLNVILGTALQGSNTNINQLRGTGYNSDALLNSFQGAPNKYVDADEEIEYKYAAFFGRIGYSWKNKYIVDVTARRDGSSRFGPGKQFGNFGSVGAAWIFTNEEFIKSNDQSFLSFGKFRGSYATTGNDQIGDYQYLNTYKITANNFQGAPSLYPYALLNPDFKWEVTKKLEAALELGLLKNRIYIEAAWFKNTSSNQLVDYQLPATTGFISVFSNFKDVTIENSGFELVLNTVNLKINSLTWTSTLNISSPKNKLVKFPDIEKSTYATTYKVGEPLSVIRLYQFDGIDAETGKLKFKDLNEDGAINDEDKVFVNAFDRKYYGGLNNTIRFKSIEVSFLLQFSKHKGSKYLPGYPGFGSTNQTTDVLKRWRNPGDQTDIPKFSGNFATYLSYANNLTFSDYAFEDASFVRLKTLSLSYFLPIKLIEKIHLSEGRIFLQGQNLFTVTKSTNLDPETGSSMPPLRMTTIGLQLKF